MSDRYIDGYREGRKTERASLIAWALSPQGATAIDNRNRRFIDLDDLLAHLRQSDAPDLDFVDKDGFQKADKNLKYGEVGPFKSDEKVSVLDEYMEEKAEGVRKFMDTVVPPQVDSETAI